MEAAKSTFDKTALAAANAIARHLMLFFMVYFHMSFTEYLTSQLPRRHGKYWRPYMKEQRR